MKKLLFVINTLRIGGAEKSLVSLLQSLDYSRFDVDLLLFEDNGVLKRDVPKEVNVLYAGDITRAMILEFRYYGRSLLWKGHLQAFLARIKVSMNSKKGHKEFSWNVIKKYIPELSEKYDLAVSYLEGYPAYYVIDKVKADRKIAWIHTDFSKKNLFREEKEYYCGFDDIVTISSNCMAAIVEKIPELSGKVQVIENITDPKRIASLAREPMESATWEGNKYNLVTVGRLTEAKGIDLAIEALQIIKEQVSGVCWHVYGDGELHDSLQEIIHQKNLNNDFILEGQVINPYPYIKNADILIQPSKWEGKSVVLDEAKILGKAIIVTDYPTAKDQIINNKTGLIVEINSGKIAEAVIRLIQDNELRYSLEQNCSNEIPAYKYTLGKIIDLLENNGDSSNEED